MSRCRLYQTEDGYAREADQRADAVFVSSHTSDHAIQADRIVDCNGWRRSVRATGAAQVPLEGIDDGGELVGELRAGKHFQVPAPHLHGVRAPATHYIFGVCVSIQYKNL